MSFWHLFVFAFVEGLTEFLPVSSTAHLILTAKVLNISQTDFVKLFEVVIQFGAIMAVLVLYAKLVLKNKKLILYLSVSLLPTVLVGFLLYSVIKTVFFESLGLIALTLFLGGLGFLAVEQLVSAEKIKLTKSLSRLTVKTALLIGLFQALAVVPGVSRAGAVILGMLILGYNRKSSVEYSFLLSVPTIALASSYDLYKTLSLITVESGQVLQLLLGVLLSFISAYLVIKLFLSFVQKHSLRLFGVYRIIIAVILWLLLI
ncbi:MAG: undecaprenyl-diphosphatase [Patescibacteria group bacterium]|nr:MAG: undecaprenyl-diphosphatase [Patescibacteria group bacterium]